MLYTVEPLYCGHLGDLVKCPVQRGVLILGVNAYLGHSKKSFFSGASFKRGSTVVHEGLEYLTQPVT